MSGEDGRDGRTEKSDMRDGDGPGCGRGRLQREMEARIRAEGDMERWRLRTDIYLETAKVVFVVIDRNGKVEYVNREGARLLGRPVEDILDQNWFENFLPTHIREDAREVFDRLMRDEIEPVREYDNPILTTDGEIRMISWSNNVLRDENGRPRATVSAGEDVTERLEMERSLERANRALKVLTLCNQALVRMDDISTLLQKVCDLIVEEGGFRMVWVGFAEDDEERSIRPVAFAGTDGAYLEGLDVSWNGSRPSGRGPTGKAIREGETCVVRDTQREQDYAPWRSGAEKKNFSSSIALPLIDRADEESGPFGALNIYSEEVDAFDEKEIDLLSELADDLSFGISAIWVRRQRRRAMAEARESRRRLAVLMENIPGMAYRCRNDRDWTMEFMSHGCSNLTGYGPGEIVDNRKVSYGDLIHEDDREMVWSVVQENLARRRQFHLTYRIRTREGRVKWVMEWGRGIFHGDEDEFDLNMEQDRDVGGGNEGPDAVVDLDRDRDVNLSDLVALEGFIMDITERKEMEELRQELARDEIFGYLAAAMPLFASQIPISAKNILVSKFGDRFEDMMRERFMDYLSIRTDGPGGPDDTGSGDIYTLEETVILEKLNGDTFQAYIEWLRDLFTRFGIEVEVEKEGRTIGVVFPECPWISGDRYSPLFCQMCRTMVIRSSTWVDEKISAEHLTSIAGGDDACSFHLFLTGT